MINNQIASENILFHSAYYDDYHTFVQNLFNYSSLINKKNELGETVLHHICFYGMIDKYYALVNMGAEIEKTNQKNTLLHYASNSGRDNFLIVELVKMNILPIEKNTNGQTSVHLAANEKIANYLHLWCNRHKSSIIELKDNDGNYVIHTAKQLGNLEVIEYWRYQYPELNNLKNNNNQTWQDIQIEQPLKTNLI